MPELPEVETIVRGLQSVLPGRTFVRVQVEWRPMVERSPLDIDQRLPGQRVERIHRRGKFLVFALASGDAMLVHLKMSGRLYVCSGSDLPDPYGRVTFDLDDGQQLRLRDPRKFGRVYLAHDAAQLLGHLGPEPLANDFSEADFVSRLARRHGAIKPLLLDQTFVAGVGNIYADEALFQAHIRPDRRAASLGDVERRALYTAVREVLVNGIDLNGATLRDGMYQGGSFQNRFRVYGRTGKPCPMCGTPIERTRFGLRSAHFCPKCQQ